MYTVVGEMCRVGWWIVHTPFEGDTNLITPTIWGVFSCNVI